MTRLHLRALIAWFVFASLVALPVTNSAQGAVLAHSASDSACLTAALTFTGDQSFIPPGNPIEPYTSADPPPLLDAWFNSDDINKRGL
ncbi:MAG: hypothetical protein ABIR57_14010, partial [Aeromicrobium sp.]